jgi:toxin ParE1/3/4
LNLVWLGEARRELGDALAYYREQAGFEVAQGFKLTIKRSAERMLQYPNLGAAAGHGARRFVVGNYPYSLIYRAQAGSVTIIAVAHQNRRPAYWAGRRF